MKQRIGVIVLELLLSLALISSAALAQGGSLAPLDIQGYGAPPDGPVVMLGQLGGGVTAVAVQGNTACVGLGARVATLDITNLDQPIFKGQSGLIPTGVAGIVITGTLAFAAALEGGVYALNLADLTKPTIVGHYGVENDDDAIAVTVAAQGNYLYVAYGANGLLVLEVDSSDPNNVILTPVGSVPASQNLFYEDVVVVGSRAYATDLRGLVILDVTNPASPTQLGYMDMQGLGKGTTGVAVSGSYAYVGLQLLTGNTLNVINVSNPASPSQAGSVDLSGNAGRLTMAGNYVYVSLGTTGVQPVNVSTPTSPTIGATELIYNTPGNPLILAAVGSSLHVADECGGYRIANLATADGAGKPVDRAAYSPDKCVTRVAATASHANINTELGLTVVDVADSALPTVAGRFEVSIANLAVVGDLVYIADGTGLRIVSITNPASPAQVGYLGLSGQPSAVAIQGSYAYVVGQSGGLKVIDIDPPETPTQVGSRSFSGAATGIAVSGNTACITVGSSGLRVINISTPAAPGAATTLDTPGLASDVAISGSLAYVADEEGGLRVVDISTPTSLKETGFYTGTFEVYGVTVAGEYAYVANGYSGISLIDVSDPAKPYEFYAYATPDTSQDVALVGDLLYVADNAGGLLILKTTVPTSSNRSLGEAWNLFSFNVEPISVTVPLTDVASILSSVDGQYASVLGYDQGARSYYPDLAAEFNDLQELDYRHGYWIKMNQANTLKIKGWPVDPTTPLALAKGWNLVSFLPGEPISITQALAGIDGQYTSVLGFHDGAAVSYYSDVAPSFSDLKCMRPQHGYWIKTTAATTLSYPSTGTCSETAPVSASSTAQGKVQRATLASRSAPSAEQAVRPDVRVAAVEGLTPTNRWSDFYSADTRCAGAPVVEGTIIQARDPQGVVCGYAVAHDAGQWGIMHVYGDDPDTAEDEGAQAGDVITFTINGKPAQVSGQPVWQERGRQELRLVGASCGPHNFLPTVQ